MSEHESDENWLVSEPVMAQWLDKDTRKPRYLGFSSPTSWRSHLVLNLGLDMVDSKRETLFWFRLPIRVKSKSAKRPTKFYVYFIIELDMFDVNGEDQAFSFSQLSVPPPVQFAFKGSNICNSDDEIVRLRFNLNKPGVVVMPKAEESPYEPSVVNQEVLLALKSLSEATKFSVFVHQKSLSVDRLQTLCWMVQHGNLQSRPRELNTLYHGKGGEVNAWQNFVLPLDQATATGPSSANNPTESFFEQKSFSFADGLEGARAASADKRLLSEKQAMLAVEEQTAVESVEKADHPEATQQSEWQAKERQGSVPPAYDQAVSSAPSRANTESAPEQRPPLRAAQSVSFPSTDRGAPPERTRQSSAPPTLRTQVGGNQPPKPLPETAPRHTESTLPTAAAPPPSYKRSKPPSDDEAAAAPARRKPRRRPHKQVRFTTSTHSPPPRSSTPHTMTATALALPSPQSTLLRATIDWFKWAWTTDARAHVALTRPHLLELGYRARVGDVAGFYRVRARCSVRVLVGGSSERTGEGGLVAGLERFLEWMAGVDPAAEVAVTGELREVGRLAREGEGEAFVHGCAVCAGFVVFRFGRVEGEGGRGVEV